MATLRALKRSSSLQRNPPSSTTPLLLPSPPRLSLKLQPPLSMRQTTLLPSNLGSLHINPPQRDLNQHIKNQPKPPSQTKRTKTKRQTHRLIIRQLIHRLLRNIQPLRHMVDGQDENLLPRLRVLDLIALAARRRIPAGNVAAAANVGEARDFALGFPTVAGDEAVGTVGAGDGGERAGAVGVAVVVGEGYGAG